MQTNLHSHDLLSTKKKNFFIHDSYEDQLVQQRFFLVLPIILAAIKTIFETVIYPHFTKSPYPTPSTAVLIIFGISCGSYIALLLIHFKKVSPITSRVKFLILILTWLIGSTYIVLNLAHYLERALISTDSQDWIIVSIELLSGLQTVIIIYIFIPIWYIRGTIPCCYALSIILALFRTDHELKYWAVTKGMVFFFIALALAFYESVQRWQVYAKNLENKAWNTIYGDLLNKMPSALAIIDLESNILYSNSEYKNLSKGDDKRLFSSIVHLKRRISLEKRKDAEEHKNFDPEKSDHFSSPKSNANSLFDEQGRFSDIDDSSFGRKSLVPLTRKSFLSQLYKQKTLHKVSNYMNLEDLLRTFAESFRDGHEIVDESHLIFDGKIEDFDETFQGGLRRLSYEVRLFPLYDSTKIILKLTNTTERDVMASLEDNNEFKDRLLASISHELRTPLNANISFLQAAINDSGISSAIKESLIDPALRSGKLLLYLINDILDYSLIQSQTLSLTYEAKSIKETLTNCYKLVEKSISMKGIKFNTIFDKNLSSKFRTDHGRVAQIVLNLLNNAAKFTFKGSITLRVTQREPGITTVSVEDTGIGMKDFEKQRMFLEPSTGLSLVGSPAIKGRSKRSKGVGLGLKICNDLAKRLSPNQTGLVVESEENKGSKFSFHIQDEKNEGYGSIREAVKEVLSCVSDDNNSSSDVDSAAGGKFSSLPEVGTLNETDRRNKNIKNFFPKGDNTAKEQINEESRTSRYTSYSEPEKDLNVLNNEVLIVDDDPINIMALTAQLRKSKIGVDEAYNGQEAIEKIKLRSGQKSRENVYKLIIMDCQMPIIDGYEATKILKQMMKDGEISNMPIIGCTAFTSKKQIDECFECGMDQVLLKPVLKDKLTEVLEQYKLIN